MADLPPDLFKFLHKTLFCMHLSCERRTIMAAAESPPAVVAGSFGCACGKVRVDVANPPSSDFVKPTAAFCQCADCYGFATAVSEYRKGRRLPGGTDASAADALTPSNAVDMRQIYKSDAAKLEGAEHLRGVKLARDSPCVRYYSACCGTPLVVDYKMAPFYLIYQHTIHESVGTTTATTTDGEVAPPPVFRKIPSSVALNHNSARPGSAPLPEGVAVRDGVSIGFVSRALLRAVFGAVAGKKKSPIAEELDKVPIGTGVESIIGTASEEEGK